MKKVTGILAVAILGLFLIVGCSVRKEGSDAGVTSDQIVIGYASKSSADLFWLKISSEINRVAKAHNMEVKEIGPSKENDVTGQIESIENLYAQDVDALIVAPCDDVEIAPIVKKFVDTGKPVISVDSGVDGVDITATVVTDNRKSSGMAADYLTERLEEDFKVVTIDRVTAGRRDRKEGFAEQLKKIAPGAQIVHSIEVDDADDADDAVYQEMQDMIQKEKEFDAVFAAWDGGALAARQALKSAGRDDVVVVGYDPLRESCQLMIEKDSVMIGSIAQHPEEMGNLAVKTAMKALKGEDVDKKIDSGCELVTSGNAEAYLYKLGK